MATSSNSINNRMKYSNALVAPTRSEIRIPFAAEIRSALRSIQLFLYRRALTITFILVATLSACYTFGAMLPFWVVLPLVAFATIGCVHSILFILSEAERFEQEKQKGGSR